MVSGERAADSEDQPPVAVMEGAHLSTCYLPPVARRLLRLTRGMAARTLSSSVRSLCMVRRVFLFITVDRQLRH